MNKFTLITVAALIGLSSTADAGLANTSKGFTTKNGTAAARDAATFGLLGTTRFKSQPNAAALEQQRKDLTRNWGG
jgi:hypothetical protein